MFRTPRILDIAFNVHDLPPVAMLVFIKMARMGNNSRQDYASQETLAKHCNCSVRTIRRVQGQLLRLGYLSPIANPKGRTNRYLLEFARWRVSSGQRARVNGSKRPVQTGQGGRQNQESNQNLNQRSAGKQSMSSTIAEALSNISQAIDKRELGENGDD